MQAFMSIFIRNLKNILFTIINTLRRVFCCFRSKSKTDQEPYVIDSSNFVIVQNQQQQQLQQQQAIHQSKNYGFSQQSLVNNLPHSRPIKDEWNNDEWIADVKPSSNKNNDNTQVEPDYFKDMTPQISKQKKYFIQTEKEQNQNATSKFGIDSSLTNSNFDDKKFQHFGSLDEDNTHGNDVYSWDDDSSMNLDHEIAQVRSEQRQHRHQQQHHHSTHPSNLSSGFYQQ